MKYSENHLNIWIPFEFPDQIAELYRNELQAPELKLEIHKSLPRGPYNMIEWAVPSLIGIYIFKTYFDTFLKEAAKDHYKALKIWLKKTAKETRSIKVTTITASESTEKIDKTNSQSKVFSIKSITNKGETITFLFDESFTDEIWNKAINEALKILEQHFIDGINDQLTIEVATKGLETTIYAKMKSDKGDWEFLSLHGLSSPKQQ